MMAWAKMKVASFSLGREQVMIRTVVAVAVCCAIWFLGGGCQSQPTSQSMPAAAPLTDEVNLPMAEVAEALYRIAMEAQLKVRASWLGGEQVELKPEGIDAAIEATSNTNSAAEALVRTMPDGRVVVRWNSRDAYVLDFWRTRFHEWLKGRAIPSQRR